MNCSEPFRYISTRATGGPFGSSHDKGGRRVNFVNFRSAFMTMDNING